MSFSAEYERYRAAFEAALIKKIDTASQGAFPSVLWESMRYSLLSGGKRIRPVLFLAALDGMGLAWEEEMPIAVAIECIHTYSLIHDDLPSMDNDDYRRGKPSNHKKFGEANAILAGDGLLSWACELLIKEGARGERYLEAAKILIHAAGVYGMVAGQAADLMWQTGGDRELNFLYENKTGKLISAPLEMASALAGNCGRAAWKLFGEALGKLFQLTDDLLDAASGEDENRLTAVVVYGYSGAEELADACAAECMALARDIPTKCGFFEALVGEIRSRKL